MGDYSERIVLSINSRQTGGTHGRIQVREGMPRGSRLHPTTIGFTLQVRGMAIRLLELSQ
jgi:hypothetical protein